jgi:hypothetical protein
VPDGTNDRIGQLNIGPRVDSVVRFALTVTMRGNIRRATSVAWWLPVYRKDAAFHEAA